MASSPDFLAHGEQARLFPVLADTSKEQRATSILLAVMTQVPELAKSIFKTIGVIVGKRTSIEAYTEVVLKQETSSPCRPDGLVIVHSSRKAWSALVEAKIGNAELDAEQVARYVELAKANDIDAVITISNQFVAKPHHSPVDVQKARLRKTKLYHWSWSSILTQSALLDLQMSVDDSEQLYLLKELNRYLGHPKSGFERFTQMGQSWGDLVQSVTNSEELPRNSSKVEDGVSSWFSEERDLCLQMSRHVGRQVAMNITRKHDQSAEERLQDAIAELISTNTLTSSLRIPDCASDVDICADLKGKTVSVSMSLRAPRDRKSTRARLNWLLRMLKEDDPRIFVRAHWPGKATSTTKEVTILRKEPEAIQANNIDLVPHTFEVILIENLGKRFSSRKKFIENIERIVLAFYDLVGVNLRAWHAPPPKPVKGQDDASQDDAGPSAILPIDATPGGAASQTIIDDDGESGDVA